MSHEPFTSEQLQQIDETLQLGYSASQVAGLMEMSHAELVHRLIKSERRVAFVNFLVGFDPKIEAIIETKHMEAD